MNVSSKWKHWKYKNRIYRGMYLYVMGERQFYLVTALKNGKTHGMPFESAKLAYDNGWRRIKPRKRKTKGKK